ncbi:MAG: shikimate dehydrogenase [Bacteroidetes bacterium]|nr:shikimate dehydrogenase [Bacteroidota bacterium]
MKESLQKLYGLIGYPLSHSFSKKYFTDKFQKEGISNVHYELFPIADIAAFPELIHAQPTLCGLNVTIPYKESVLPFLNHSSQVVKDIGACNCIKIVNGERYGFNTDVIGFEKMLLPYLKPIHKKALILGTGGAAKAVAWVLQQLQISFQYVSRKPGYQHIAYEELDETGIAEHLLIINTTPLGMSPDIHSRPPVPMQFINVNHLCVDLIYNPAKTLFLEQAEMKGATILNGHEMLIIQAEESWKIWNANPQ